MYIPTDRFTFSTELNEDKHGRFDSIQDNSFVFKNQYDNLGKRNTTKVCVAPLMY